jgi:farnesyl-diphosphate farnesyltransferase
MLPGSLREPLSLAYLLARATDTIADTPEPPVELRTDTLRNLARIIQGNAPTETAVGIRTSFARLQSNDAERALIDALPAILKWLELIDDRDRREVRNVLTRINQGQMLDLERFGAGIGIQALPTAAELDEYTYLVAGSVGEFWTHLCFAHVQNFSDRTESEMLALGVQYGKGLQLINILRDVGSDLRMGRCYLPEDELNALGLTPAEILAKPAGAERIVRYWREKAEQGLTAGMDYACAIRSRRIRFATALPALIGARTLALMREAGAEVFERKVKVSREEVKKMMASTAVRLASPRALREKFRRLS